MSALLHSHSPPPLDKQREASSSRLCSSSLGSFGRVGKQSWNRTGTQRFHGGAIESNGATLVGFLWPVNRSQTRHSSTLLHSNSHLMCHLISSFTADPGSGQSRYWKDDISLITVQCSLIIYEEILRENRLNLGKCN